MPDLDLYGSIAALAQSLERQSRVVSIVDALATTNAKETHMITLMVEDVFHIAERGVVATGTIVGGTLTTGVPIRVERADGQDRRSRCEGIERGREVLPSAGDGEIVGVLLAGLSLDDVESGDRLVVDNSG